MSKNRHTPADLPPSFVPICAIGASAGGVGALQTLFRLLPEDLGLAYVVVVHLSPKHPNAMHEILATCTEMPVYQVTDGPSLMANCVYVIAPDSELVIDGNIVRARPFTDPRGKRAPIDMFFRSIAAGREDGIAVVLTGAGSDGALGVRAIKEAGGIVMVQEPAEAGFPSMPQNAIATGVADVVAPLARLAERIVDAAHSKEAVRSLDEDGAANDIRRIVAFLGTRTGHDFSGYKRSTVLRRIQRRMQVAQINSLADYAAFLRTNPEEAKELLSDLLISVTMFFRPALTESRFPTVRFDAGEVLGESHAAALEASAPPSALVDAEQGVLHLSPSAGRFILLSAGPLSGRLASIVRPELRLDLKLALDRAFDTFEPTITRPIDVVMEGATRRVSLHIAPLPVTEGVAPRALVYFLDSGPGQGEGDEASAPPIDELQHLHSELKVAQEAELAGRMRHESVVQELRASNEELQSLNEEYRSTAEELETSKEELQSINEELQTVNAELKSKLAIISAAHNDLKNLNASSEIGTLSLDLELRIRMFTPRVAELINVAEADVGRPITNFTHRLDYDGIAADVRRVLRDLTPIEVEARAVDGHWFMIRIRPYQTMDGKVEGAVATFDDITQRKESQEVLAEELRNTIILQRLGARLVTKDNVQAIYEEVLTAAIEITRAKAGTVQMLDAGAEELVVLATRGFSKRTEKYFHRVDAGSSTSCGLALRTGERSYLNFDPSGADLPTRLHVEDGILSAQSSILLSRSGNPIGMVSTHWGEPDRRLSERELRFLDLLVRQAADLIEQQRADAALRKSLARFQALAKTAGNTIYHMSADWRLMYQLDSDTLAPTPQPIEDWVEKYIPAEDLPAVRTAIAEAIRDKTMFELEHRVRRADGSVGWVLSRAMPLFDSAGEIAEWFGAGSDVTERRRAVDQLSQSEAQYRLLLDGIDDGFCSIEVLFDSNDVPYDYRFLKVNPAFERQTGLRDAVGKTMLSLAPEHEPFWFETYGRIARNGRSERFEHRADALGRWYEVAASPMGDHGENQVAIVFRDILQKREAEEALRSSEARLREREADLARVQRIGGVGGLDLNIAGGMVSQRSPEYLRLHGLSPEAREETHADWRARVHPDDAEKAERVLLSALEGDATSYESEYRIVRPVDGAVRWIAARADIERDATGKAIRMVGAHIDITEQKNAQEALRESEARLRGLG